MIINSSGNVGIGTTSPDAQLEIEGTVEKTYLHVDGIAGNAGIGSTQGAMVKFYNNGDGHTVKIQNNNSSRTDATVFSVWTQTNSRFLIRNDGKVGIGTTSPSDKLDVSGRVVADAFRTDINTGDYSLISRSSAGNAPLYVQSADSSTNQPIAKFFYGNASPNQGALVLNVGKDISYFTNTNVGIGTTSPDSLLNLEGSRNNAILTIGNSTNDSNWTTGDKLGAINFYSADNSGAGSGVKASLSYEVAAGTSSATNAMVFRTAGTTSGTNNTERMRITAAGGISFGSTGTAYGTSGQVLTSAGNASPTWTTPTTGTVTSITKGAGLVVAGSPITTTGSVAVEYAANVNNIITGGNNFIGDTAVLTDQILITDPGVTSTNRRVGNIELGDLPFLPFSGGTMTGAIIIPEYITHAGDTDTKFGFTAANQFQVIAGGNTNLNVQGNGVDLSYAGSTKLTTQTGGIAITGDLTVTADVGIGLTNPDVPLHVTANEDGSGIDKGAAKFINTNTGQGATTMHMVQTSSSNFANAVKFWQGSTPTAVGFIRLTTSATQFITSASDLNLKKNITNWSDDTLSKFKALEPKKFRFKTQDVSEDKTLGFIAQNEVDNFPEAYPQFLGDNEQPYYGFNPTGMVPHLMKAIKDLVEKVETLENRITQLENNN